MLKIKDNVNLTEHGFQEYSSIWFKDYVVVDKETMEIVSVTTVGFNTLFDLIRAGLVEKIGEVNENF